MCSLGFKEDDMLQEGLQEIVETKTFKVRVVPKTNSTTETVVEDGVVYLQCAADRWVRCLAVFVLRTN